MFSETMAGFLIDRVGIGPYFVIVLVVLLFPATLIWVVIAPLMRGYRRPWYGLALGFGVGIQASLCELFLPYVGLYANLLGGVLALAVVGDGADDTWVGQVCIHGTNMVFWPLLGWLAFRVAFEKKRMSA